MANDLLAMIREKKAQIAKLQAELAEATRLLTEPDNEDASDSAVPPTGTSKALKIRVRKRGRLRIKRRLKQRPLPMRHPGTQTSVTMALDVLREAREPMHVKRIIERIQTRFEKDVKKDTLVGNLVRMAHAGKTFYRAGPNTYGLLEFERGEERKTG
jgi:hypothetical protein